VYPDLKSFEKILFLAEGFEKRKIFAKTWAKMKLFAKTSTKTKTVCEHFCENHLGTKHFSRKLPRNEISQKASKFSLIFAFREIDKWTFASTLVLA
jgi:hypothetical protein